MKLRWRRPRPALTDTDPLYWSRCFTHGPEPLDENTYCVCPECGHVWSADALVAAHNDLIEELGGDQHLHRHHPHHVHHCPLCAHDF